MEVAAGSTWTVSRLPDAATTTMTWTMPNDFWGHRRSPSQTSTIEQRHKHIRGLVATRRKQRRARSVSHAHNVAPSCTRQPTVPSAPAVRKVPSPTLRPNQDRAPILVTSP